FCLCAQRRGRTRRRRTCRSPETGRRRPLFKHRSPEGWISRSTENPRLVRSHLFGGFAQGGDTGGMNGDLKEIFGLFGTTSAMWAFCDSGEDRRPDRRVPPAEPVIVSLASYMCQRSLSRNDRVRFYETIFGCITLLRWAKPL